MDKIVISMEGGIIQEISSTNKDIKILVVDRDTEGLEDSEIGSIEELKCVVGNETYYDADYELIISEDDIPFSEFINR